MTDSQAQIIRMFRDGGGSRPEVALVRTAGGEAVRKDFNRCSRWFALFLGPLLARRESAALRRLRGLEGVPELVQGGGRRVVLMQHVDGKPPLVARGRREWEEFFRRLEALIAGMHRRGVAHGDLRNPNNILVDAAGNPFLVDFVTSYTLRSRRNFFSSWVFRKMSQVDRSAVVKLKLWKLPDSVGAEEIRKSEQHPLLEKSVRFAARVARVL